MMREFKTMLIWQIQIGFEGAVNSPEIEESVQACINSARDLSRHLANAAISQAQDLNAATKHGLEIVASIREQALSGDIDRLHHTSDQFLDSIDHILEVVDLLPIFQNHSTIIFPGV